MNIFIFSFTERGKALGKRLAVGLESSSNRVQAFCGLDGRASLNVLLGELWADADALVFVSAAGIAVRGIAPFVVAKECDPAVAVVTEDGKFAISLLSGHIGGANKLVKTIAEQFGATAVISTATDLNGVFAFDTWAAEHNCGIADISKIKGVSAALLRNERVTLFTEYRVLGTPPLSVDICTGALEEVEDNSKNAVVISVFNTPNVFSDTLHIVPRIVCVGVGCRKNSEAETVIALVSSLLRIHAINELAVEAVATIDLKAGEPALIALSGVLNVPLVTFSAAELAAVPGTFSTSEFVERTVGVDNVCERAAMSFAGGERSGAKLIVSKHAESGVTIAIAVKDMCVAFDEIVRTDRK
jgi:cobalt-precorrin 5A hydrolase